MLRASLCLYAAHLSVEALAEQAALFSAEEAPARVPLGSASEARVDGVASVARRPVYRSAQPQYTGAMPRYAAAMLPLCCRCAAAVLPLCCRCAALHLLRSTFSTLPSRFTRSPCVSLHTLSLCLASHALLVSRFTRSRNSVDCSKLAGLPAGPPVGPAVPAIPRTAPGVTVRRFRRRGGPRLGRLHGPGVGPAHGPERRRR
jgi:hypothetical protein